MIFLLIVEFSLVAAMGLSWSSSFDEQLEQAALEEAELAVDARKAGCPGPLGGKRRNMTPLVGVTLGTFASIWGWVKTCQNLYCIILPYDWGNSHLFFSPFLGPDFESSVWVLRF